MAEEHTILMFNLLEALAEDVIHVDQFRMTSICHPVITNEHNIDNTRQVAQLNLKLKIPCECIDIYKCFLDM